MSSKFRVTSGEEIINDNVFPFIEVKYSNFDQSGAEIKCYATLKIWYFLSPNDENYRNLYSLLYDNMDEDENQMIFSLKEDGEYRSRGSSGHFALGDRFGFKARDEIYRVVTEAIKNF